MKRLTLVALAPGLAFGVACSSPNVTCPEGRILQGDVCAIDPVAADQVAPTVSAYPPGGSFGTAPTVTLSASEPATIYYTTDGSDPTTSSTSGASPLEVADASGEIRFIGVDAAGNQSEIASESYDVTETGLPPDLASFNAVVNAQGGVDLSWTLPADAEAVAGVLVVTGLASDLGFTPTPGTTYTVGSPVAAGVDAIHNGDGSATTHDTPYFGLNHYEAWTFDSAGNFSQGSLTASVDAPLGVQTGTIHVSVADKTATVVNQPHDVRLNVAGGSIDIVDGEIRFTVQARNDAPKRLMNPKFLVDTVVGATMVGEGALNGKILYQLKVGALDSGSSSDREFRLINYTGTQDPLVIDVTVRTSPLLITSGLRNEQALLFWDAESVATRGFLCDEAKYPKSQNTNDDRCQFMDGTLDDDGNVILTSRNTPSVTRLPLSGDSIETFQMLGADDGSGAGIEHDAANNLLYVAIKGRTHRRVGGFAANSVGSDETYLMKLDAETLTEISRATLTTDPNQNVRDVAISPDGTRALVAIDSFTNGQRGVAVVNTADMSVITFINEALRNGTPELFGGRALSVAFSPDGSQAYFGAYDANDLVIIDMNNATAVYRPVDGIGTNPMDMGDLDVAPDGKVYVPGRCCGDGNSLRYYDPATDGWTLVHGGPGNTRSMFFSGISQSGDLLYSFDRTEGAMIVVDLSTSTVTDTIDHSNTNGLGHLMLVVDE